MACSCGKQEHFGAQCHSCFQATMESRIRQSLRETPITKGESLVVRDPFCRAVLTKILNGLPINVVDSAAREIIAWTADDEISAFLEALFYGKPLPIMGNTPKSIKLFLALTDTETQKLAELYQIPWQPKQKPDAQHIEALAKKYPEMKSALMKSLRELGEVLRE